MNENNYNKEEIDFEKLNSTLANPDFANWYYNEFMVKDNVVSIDEFVNIINTYNSNNIQS
ncbi:MULTISPECIES: hypothetical protein [Romboutsia]|uniref:Uncharacterized protein n=1 Tax=Romboutsia hominis TaxID=1507512 RepID=A0A2P2BSR2_9FIRM|nr:MULTISPECIES: hypothetical protein [Romboutsia]MCH1960694.1 hypothetical protein [Romboutsia hominis]MCH1968874.1 hypothetical protein [Romboutsia hominis]MDB8791578.1 hypothetical protein [Romboutsia sp. 1001216sp1]MDB8793606.1 hypothetical protein [Romboutsia sp. 1001216sp1]MDB8795003.1 hypothetical protein [Romboutsia sp. 1001216sp1]